MQNEKKAVTFGQYLQPTRKHMAVSRYVEPAEFDHWGQRAKELGFDMVASGPMVRSSYKAGELFLTQLLEKEEKQAALRSSGL